MFVRLRAADVPVGLVVFALVASGCGDTTGPRNGDPGVPTFVVSGTQAAIRGVGTLGTGTAEPGGNLQEFDFDAAADLTGRVFYRDWRFSATLTVEPGDPATAITAFRDGSTMCAFPADGAEFDAIGRRETGDLEIFTVVACDEGPAASGADGLQLTTVLGYRNAGRLASGDVVKTMPDAPAHSIRATGQGYIGSSVATPGMDRLEFTFEATNAPSGRVVVTDYAVVRSDGSPGQMIVDPAADPATRITSFNRTSPTCVRFGGIGRLNDNDQLFTFHIDACDNAATATADTFAVTLPLRPYANGGKLTDGDIAIATTEPPPPTGQLRVTTTTAGTDPDADGYTVRLDGGLPQPVASNGSITFTDLAVGDHVVELLGVATNCTVSDGAARTVTVPPGQTFALAYSVSCVAINQPPVVNAGPDQTVAVGLLYTLSASFGDANHNGPWSYTVDWGDGTRTRGTRSSEGTISLGHAYYTLFPRSFTIRVTVVDAAGAAASDTKVITVLLL